MCRRLLDSAHNLACDDEDRLTPVIQAEGTGSASRDGSAAASRRLVMTFNGLTHHRYAEPWPGRRQRQTFYARQSPLCSCGPSSVLHKGRMLSRVPYSAQTVPSDLAWHPNFGKHPPRRFASSPRLYSSISIVASASTSASSSACSSCTATRNGSYMAIS